jgi:hypothetical protein
MNAGIFIRTAEEREGEPSRMASHGGRGLKGVLLDSETRKVLPRPKIPVRVFR